jgi:DNA replication licensing factor MCM2
VDPENDRRLARFVIDSHNKSHPSYEEPADIAATPVTASDALSQDMLKKYILYAKKHCHPKLHNIDDDKIAKLYSDLRRESMSSGGIPIAIRHIESIIRMSESHAKMHLREYVIEDDVNMAIRVMLESFITSQKFSVMRTLRKHFKKYITYKKDSFELLLYVLKSMVNESLNYKRLKSQASNDRGGSWADETVEIEVDEYTARATEMQITNLTAFYNSELFAQAGFRLDKKRKVIVRVPEAK